MAVIAAVSNVLDTDPLELDPLHDTIDTDALDDLVRCRGPPNEPVDVSFTVEGHKITVFSEWGGNAHHRTPNGPPARPSESRANDYRRDAALVRSGVARRTEALLRRAYDSDLEIEGGWDCRNGTDYPDWDVIVTEVRKNEVPKQEIPATDE